MACNNTPISILFVCLGNICRSPLAEGIAKDIAKKQNLNLVIESAGTGSWHIGNPPCENSILIGKKYGVDISTFKAQQVKVKDFTSFKYIVGLDRSNVENLKKMGCKNPLLLGDFGFHGEDVPDPYYFDGIEGFDKVFKMIESCVISLITQIAEGEL